MTYPGVEEQTEAPEVLKAAPAEPKPPAAEPYGLKAWGDRYVRHEFDVVCPSGQRCRAKELQIEDAMSLGMLESLDVFTSALMKDEAKGEEDSLDADAKILQGLKNPEKRAKFFGTVNKVVAHTVLIPKVVLIDDGHLPEGTVFVNDIPFQDKMHIFRAVFGQKAEGIQSFREGQEGSVAAVEKEPSVPLPTE